MKALVLKQPWATLVANGIVDVLQFNKETEYRGRVLLYAKRTMLSVKDYEALPIEWIDTIDNHIDFGNLEGIYEKSAFIGFADLIDITKEPNDSIWSKGKNNNFRWVFANAHVFDHPYPFGSKTNSLLIDVPEIDEANLPPYHKAELKYPYYEGTELVVPIGDDKTCTHLLYTSFYGYEDCIWDTHFYDERLQRLLMGDFKRKKQNFCKTIRFESPIRSVRFKVLDSAIGEAFDEYEQLITHPSALRNKDVIERVFVFRLGDMIEMIPPKTVAHELQMCNTDSLFEDGLTKNTLWGLGTPRGINLRLIKAENEGIGDRSYIAMVNGGKVLWKDDDDKFWEHISVDPVDGIWHAFLLKYFWTYLPLWWHANYDRRDYVYSTNDLVKIIAKGRTGAPIEKIDPTQYDVSPRITYKGHHRYVVSACYWSEFGGLIRSEVPIELRDCGNELYDRIMFGKERTTILCPYNCGICY